MDFFEESKVILRIQMKKSDGSPVPDGTMCAVEISAVGKLGTQFSKKAPAGFGNGTAAVEYTTEKLGPDEMSRKYLAFCFIDGDRTVFPQLLRFTVWARTIQVELKNPQGQPVKNVLLRLTSGDKYSRTDTGDDGKAKLPPRQGQRQSAGPGMPVPAPGPIGALAVEFPFVLHGAWTHAPNSRTFKGIVTSQYKTRFIQPAAGHVTQYVNLQPGQDHLDYGHKLWVYVAAGRPAKAGDPIYIAAEFDPNNSRRNDPKPAIDGAEQNGAPNKFKLTLHKTEGQDWEAFEVELGVAGGDKLTLKVGSTPGVWDGSAVDEVLEFTTRRKIFYQVTHAEFNADDIPAEVKKIVDAELDWVGIELEKVDAATKSLTVHELRMLHPGMVVTRDRLSLGTKDQPAFVCAPALHLQKFGRFTDQSKGSLLTQVVLCDGFFKAAAPVTKIPILKTKQKVMILAGPGQRIFRTSLADGIPSLKLEWRPDVGLDQNHHFLNGHPQRDRLLRREWFPLALADAVRLNPKQPRMIKIVLPDGVHEPGSLAGEKSPDKWPVAVRIRCVPAEDCGMLGAHYGSITFLLANATGNNTRALAKTLLHELGHAMGQAVVPLNEAAGGFQFIDDVRERQQRAVQASNWCGDPPPGVAPHTTAYVGRGHQGPHCYFGTALKASFGADDFGRCIMFGAGTDNDADDPPNEYCAGCRRMIRATELKSIRKIHTFF